MAENYPKTPWGLGSLGFLLGLSLVVSTVILTRTIKEIKSENLSIEVSGFAQKKIASDWATWDCSFSARAQTLADSNRLLEETRKKVEAFLLQKGAKPAELELAPPTVRPIYGQDEHGRQTNVLEGYVMSQQIQYASADIERVAKTAQESSELAGQGIAISADTPSYYYTKLDDLKMEMLGEAATNARQRAEKLASQNNSGIGALRYIHQGVFQITPPYSTEVSDHGMNDTTSKMKMIKAIVTARYAVAN